ncbi:MAG: 2-isopropylmalate synthase [Gammaproteobacteria bacterium]|nr:2-isopropylmalate synthase [Gammaproteobacteria bacterium]
MSYDHRKYSAFRPVRGWQRKWPDQVIDRAPDWCAVDLRDGNQALVNPMTVEQKTQLFSLLVDIGCKEIEVGFPAASQPDFDFVRKIIETDLVPEDVTIQVLTQAREQLIARSIESLKGAKKASIHLYNSTSTVQRERVFGMDREAIKGIAVQGARWIKDMVAQHPETEWEFQYSPESFTGTELDYCAEVVNAVVAVWQPETGQKVVINLPATVEMSTPNIYADMIEWMCAHIEHRDKLRVSLHTHNDRGCGVAAAELGVMAGADRVEGTLLGNGERTGNMCLVTMAMNLYSQGVDPQLDFSDMRRIVRTVEQCTGISTHPRHAYAGELVYTAFSGSHQDAIRKSLARQQADEAWQVAYLPIDPGDVGRSYEEVVRINSQSGKGGVLYVFEREFGITLPRWLQIELSRVVQRHAEQTGGEVGSAVIRQLFDDAYVAVPEGWRLGNFDIHRDGSRVRVEASIGGRDLAGEGNGAVEALMDALRRVHGVNGSVEAFDEYALGSGTAASAMACIKLQIGTEVSVGVALAEDTTTATLQAVLSAFGRQKAAVMMAA